MEKRFNYRFRFRIWSALIPYCSIGDVTSLLSFIPVPLAVWQPAGQPVFGLLMDPSL